MDNANNKRLELVANIWPIFDELTGMIQRIAARAYALPGANDRLISAVLTQLALTDFNLAKQFKISDRFIVSTSYGKVAGCVQVSAFNQHEDVILQPIYDALTEDRPKVIGIALASGTPTAVRPFLQFADSPYRVITFLQEDFKGNLTPISPD